MANCLCGSIPYSCKVRAKVGDFERCISLRPGYVCPVQGGQSHGVAGVKFLFMLIGEDGAMEFSISTPWRPDWHEFWKPREYDRVMPCGIEYHSKTPQYDGHKKSTDDCEWTGGDCWCDGSALQAMDVFKVLVTDGEDALWRELERRYESVFHD